MSPLPDVSGLPPDQAETLMAQWQADFEQYGKDLEIWKAYGEAQDEQEHRATLEQSEGRGDGYLRLERKKAQYRDEVRRSVEANARLIEETMREIDFSDPETSGADIIFVNALRDAEQEYVADMNRMTAEVEAKQAEIMRVTRN